MKQTLNVEKCNYDIIISDHDFSELMEDVNLYTSGQKRLFIVSSKVFKLYAKKLNLNINEVLVLNDGEKEKNFKNYIKILETAIRMGLARSDVIISLGGGVIGDIAGFAASTYMRGIDYIQIPTTLLSMVDSSVGGKTAIDMEDAKNIVGTFYQPKRVFININFLKTLDSRQYNSGLGEVLKYAFIEDNCKFEKPLFLFEYLTLCAERLQEKDLITLARVIEYCLNLKISVVNKDEKEKNLRKILNFGHTYAHAIETLSKYKKYTHGEAVIQGMYFVLKWAYNDGLITYSYYRLSLELLEKYGFKNSEVKYTPSEIIDIMKRDKKVQKNKIVFLLPCEKRKVKEVKITPVDLACKF